MRAKRKYTAAFRRHAVARMRGCRSGWRVAQVSILRPGISGPQITAYTYLRHHAVRDLRQGVNKQLPGVGLIMSCAGSEDSKVLLAVLAAPCDRD
jgi:hypothetical protein